MTYLYRKIIIKPLAQAAYKNTKFMFLKTGRLLFSKNGSRSDCPGKKF